MNYAKIILEAELKSLKSREFPWLIKKFGGDKGQLQRITDVENALLILNGEIRESCTNCPHCKSDNISSLTPKDNICDDCGKSWTI